MRGAESTAPAHLDALTGIRGIAAWLVVFYHMRFSLLTLLPIDAIKVLARGYLAVDLFFILSGFVLWYNYAPRLRDGGLIEAGRFLWRRIARIWPLHIVLLGLFVIYALALLALGRDASFYPFAELPLHVLLMQNWGFTEALRWNDPSWSISTEMAAYLVFPLIVLAAKWERMPTAVLVAIGLGLAAAIPLYFWSHGQTSIGADISQFGLGRCLFEFSLGNVMCLLWLRWRGQRHAALAALFAGTVFLGVAVALRLPETVLVPIPFVAGLLALALGRGPIVRLLGMPVMRYLGEISYATYLAHTFLFLVFRPMLVDAQGQLGWLPFLTFVAILLAASAGFYHLLEKPAQRWFNRHPPRLRLRANEVPAE
ncbi:MAG: acyltransferase [Novosphingobium sp.]|nr:MAG: acyltransferase [Novosphingobium sp.]